MENTLESRLEKILPLVEKPGRYVGGEFNAIVKDWSKIYTKIGLVFPDIYDIGLSNLGIQILYESINMQPNLLAERVYSPWSDMEQALRDNHIPLFSLETKHPLVDFDILGFSLPYETLYTNALNILDLAQVPIRSADRNENHPLVISGGHASYNPEPIAPFFDAVLLGEGEEIIFDLIAVYQDWKGNHQPRKLLLEMISQIPGVYVPSFYEPLYHEDGTIKQIVKTNKNSPDKITKRIMGKLPLAPTKFIVPSIGVVHNRIAIEIMRGCTRGCRFCHAGMINRPIRERSVEEILETIDIAMKNTGFEEIALLSLSSSDYSNILELVDSIGKKFAGRNLTVSLPSLRIDSFSVELMEKLKGSRQGGFTLAPEAATDRMRAIINKPISEEQLLATTREIYKRGWHTIKLYFMIGHPSETIEDVQAIVNLCKRVIYEGTRIIGKRAQLNAGVSTFVPKPHTPFQWVSCDDQQTIREKQNLLRHELRGPGLKLNWTDPHETMLEAWLSRGDRRMADIIEGAWRKGAKFDAWQDHQNYELWMQAFSENEIDPAFYTHRNRPIDEVFPWDHISPGVDKSFIFEEFQNSQSQILRNDCREQCYACGIIQNFKEIRSENPGTVWKCPDVKKTTRVA